MVEIAGRAIRDYGFRQVVLWSPDDVIGRWALSSRESQVLLGPIREALEALPIPVEPEDIPQEQDRFARLIGDALGS